MEAAWRDLTAKLRSHVVPSSDTAAAAGPALTAKLRSHGVPPSDTAVTACALVGWRTSHIAM